MRQPWRCFPVLIVWLHGPHLETKGRNTLCGQNLGGIILIKAEQSLEPGGQTTGSVETQNLHASSVTAALIHWYLCMVMRFDLITILMVIIQPWINNANHPKRILPFWGLLGTLRILIKTWFGCISKMAPSLTFCSRAAIWPSITFSRLCIADCQVTADDSWDYEASVPDPALST